MNQIRRVFHADHGVSDRILQWAVAQLGEGVTGVFLRLRGPRSGEPEVLDDVWPELS